MCLNLIFSSPQDLYFSDRYQHSYNRLRKCFSNTSIESLTVSLRTEGKLGKGSLLDKVCDLIKEFNNVGSLTVEFEFFVYIMDKSFLLGLLESCPVVTLLGVNQISSDALTAVYNKMVGGSPKCCKLESDLLTGHFYWFLIGIRIEIVPGGANFANRDIQAYRLTRNERTFVSIFEGRVELAFSDDYELSWNCEMHFALKLHETDA
ncbi:hypothetical protein PMAYCL1PPCAC_00486, partial [Pristionchus mayeri]